MRLDEGLHRIGNDIVAAYLVVTEDGVTVVDAGLAGHWRELTAELAGLGRSLRDVRGVVLTHGDTDHLGFAERLRREHDVPIYVHHADAARARGEVTSRPVWSGARIGPMARFLWYAAGKGGLRTDHPREVVEFDDGDVLELPGAPRVLGLPGHSPGSVAVQVPAVDALFVGDALTTRHVLTGRSGPQAAPFTDDPTQALHSLDRLAEVRAKWVLPGHGAPWSGGVQEAVRQVRESAGRPPRTA
ncbi:glyoxylase-like metal-dependent hydrolase (beta-lactamase superfamily II) [Actinoalloteichus hoggarensis]|uniref:Putative metallo-hydrolase YflN n=1 Tax=Actinoalloteichus hoggarensis TaxID=1470176 RepID=A0A221W3R9_9PSEU|nr:MBL fold metallo-hydrolase [Actinoalloteichus hoggarensis]ASO20475.1 putative metallo-hydrolase YflN [Actinoalloteichus hoggarensis]MBB5923515.1 glyoxylase-like metal-dependent hydrolase (beta-lactamase superfamily II) [Actinoalloteichus hoggarensis]